MDNITFFDTKPDVGLAERCAKLACIHEEILTMPMKYSSLVGDMGSTLSGGQKQRVLIARALYKKPKILLLDEATSHLDVKKEIKVSNAIRHLKLTRIAIAHRSETAVTADRIITFSKGKIILKAGAGSINDILISQQAFLEAKLSSFDLVLTWRQAWLDLLQAAGNLTISRVSGAQ